jgi:ornithine cyclodeaminase/alanine dehydrogenase-like protein (mu-crystallin family)
VLLIDNPTTASVLTMRAVIDTLEDTYRDLAAGTATCRPRIDLRYPVGDGRSVYQWGTMEGGSRRSGYHAIRMKSDVVREVEYGGTRTQEKFCVEPGRFCGLVLLLSTRTGEPLALLNDGVLQHMRVGADSAIGTRYAARPDARVLGILGSGGMARSHLEALLAVRPLERVQVYSPTRAHRERYATEMTERHGVDVVAVDEPREAFRGADIVAGCTDAAGDVIVGDWLEPGTHVTCIGGRPDARTHEVLDTWFRLGTAPARWTTPTGARRTSTSPTSPSRRTRCGASTPTAGCAVRRSALAARGSSPSTTSWQASTRRGQERGRSRTRSEAISRGPSSSGSPATSTSAAALWGSAGNCPPTGCCRTSGTDRAGWSTSWRRSQSGNVSPRP